MSDAKEIIDIFRKYWRILLKWILQIHDYPEITVNELFERINSNESLFLIDVRGVEDYMSGHILNAVSIPMLELEYKFDELEEYKDKEIITMCPGGGLSLAAVDVMREAGFKDVKSLKGGTDEWRKKGYPLTARTS